MNCNGIDYNIISTGSMGNAVVVNNIIMIDCGVSFKALKDCYKALKLVLLTHIHSDHFNTKTIRRLATERPTLRFGCGRWLVDALVKCGVNKANIDILESRKMYVYGSVSIIPEMLVHNVPNQGYKVHFGAKRMFYATDTNNLDGISAYDYDLLLIEANYTEAEIKERIAEKKQNGEYAYEIAVTKNHLSKERCDAWIAKNATSKTMYAYMHCHVDKEE